MPDAAAMLAQLAVAFDIHWATRWGESANVQLSPELGLPILPVLELSGPKTQWAKLPAIREAAGSRPAAWIDDDLGHEEWSWADNRREPTMLVKTDMTGGMTGRDVEELLAFAASLRRKRPPGSDRPLAPLAGALAHAGAERSSISQAWSSACQAIRRAA